MVVSYFLSSLSLNWLHDYPYMTVSVIKCSYPTEQMRGKHLLHNSYHVKVVHHCCTSL